MITVYQIINPSTNRSYVGITGNLYKRFKQHRTDAHVGGSKLSQAIRKHGWENLQCKIIGIFELRQDARQEEIKTIQKINSYKDGYNGSPGGDGVDPKKIRGAQNVFYRPEVKAKVIAALHARIEGHRQRMLTNNPMLNAESRNKVMFSKIGKSRSKDTVRRSRQTLRESGKVRGENNPSAKISEDDVKVILNCPRGYGQNVMLADLYGVSVNLICKIRARKVWSHVVS